MAYKKIDECFLGFRIGCVFSLHDFILNTYQNWSGPRENSQKWVADTADTPFVCHGGIKAREIMSDYNLPGFFEFFSREVFLVNKEWLKVFMAAFFEVFWVIGLKHANHFWEWIGTGISILISFYVLIMAGKKLPVGTVYAVFVGLGTAGTVASEILFFDEPFKMVKLLLIICLLVGVVGLKLVTSDKESERSEG